MDHKKSTGKKIAKALAELKFRRLGKHVMELSDYDEIQFCEGTSEVWNYWPNKPDGDAQ
jgi:hypothetical protein